MPQAPFDALCRMIAARSSSRRSFLGLLAAIVAGVVPGVAQTTASAARKRRRDDRRQVQPEVVGGVDVPDGKYPFVAALLDYSFGDTTFKRQFCGGSLIAPTFVLTAAHCVADYGDTLDIDDLHVLVGRQRLSATSGEVRGVTRIAIHPGYAPATFSTPDVAILELDEPIVATAPVAITEAGDTSLGRPGSFLTVAGWGDTIQHAPGEDDPHDYPDRMREAELRVQADQVCRDFYGSDGFDGAIMICAGTEGKSACFGDSGGPIFGTVGGAIRVAGIVKAGIGCGDEIPGTYTQLNAPSIAGFIGLETGACDPRDNVHCSPFPQKPKPKKKHKKPKKKHKKRR
jgi:secreted trypsin-like serine protease